MTARISIRLIGPVLALALLPSVGRAAVSVSPPEPATDAATGVVESLMFGAEAPKLTEAAEPGLAGDVPEPATWAMMLVGFGLIGAYLRGCRSLAA